MIKNKIYGGFFILSIFLFQGCCSTKNIDNNMNNNSLQQNFKKPFPRGVIETTITVNEVWSNERNNYCKAAINIVHKTGGGIRPIAENTFYTFGVEDELFKQLENEMGKTIKCRIAEVNNSLNNDKHVYKIISILKN